jgi:cation:H+ antiporter
MDVATITPDLACPAALAASAFDAFFADRSSWVLWLAAGVAVALLVAGADRAVGAAVRLARFLHIPQVIIGATVVSLGTTAPEAFVSVSAAIQGNGGLALGNGVGSIICNAALIFGFCAILRPLPKDRFVLARQGTAQLVAAVLLLVVAFALALLAGGFAEVFIPRTVGLGLLGLLAIYLCLSARWAKDHPEMLPPGVVEPGPENVARRHPAAIVVGNLLLLGIGLGLVILGSKIMISSVTELADRYGVPSSVLAVTVVALGTSLPELATALASLAKGHPGLLVGNVVGANILNILFVVGAAATAVPLRIDGHFFYLDLPVMVAILLLLRVFIVLPSRTFRRWQGATLLAIYVAFTVILIRTNPPQI